MKSIRNKVEYDAMCARIEELLKVVSNNTSTTNKDFIELDFISDLVADYEEVSFPITPPTLAEVMKLRMEERGLTQVKVAELLEVSAPRITEYMKGKEPTLKIARTISKKLNIEPSIVLGV